MILSDVAIHEAWGSSRIAIRPYNATHLKPASYDLTLGGDVLTWTPAPDGPVRLSARVDAAPYMERVHLAHGEEFFLPPGGFVLCTTAEWVLLPADLVGRVEGRSSLARRGIAVHVTGGFIDPGFGGHITLEVANLNPVAAVGLVVGMRIAQLAFQMTYGPATNPYQVQSQGSKYFGQEGTTASRLHLDFAPDAASVAAATDGDADDELDGLADEVLA